MGNSEHKRFMQQLEEFQEENGIDTGTPLFAKKPVDQFKLWCAVQEVGGHTEVMASKGWARIGRMFDPPKTMTDLSFRIKKIYETHVLPFEKAMLRGDVTEVYMPPRIHLPTPTPSEKKASRPSKRQTAPVPPNTRPKRARKESTTAGSNDQDELVGKRIRVLWPDEKQFFSGTVTSFEKDLGVHRIAYDDGDEELLDLDAQTWHLISENEDDDMLDDGGLDQLHSAAEALAHDTDAHGTTSNGDKSASGVPIPQGCIVQGEGFRVFNTKDGTGFEVFCLVPGLQMEDLSVKCWNSGKLLVCQNLREREAAEKWGLQPLKHKIRLPKPVDAQTARALVTLHGQLYISVAWQKNAVRQRRVPGTQSQPPAAEAECEQPVQSNPEGTAADGLEQQRSTSPEARLNPEESQPGTNASGLDGSPGITNLRHEQEATVEGGHNAHVP